MSVDEAEALGYPVRSHVAQAFGEAASVSVELLLTAPPSLWIDRGLEPPSDRGVQAVLTLRDRGLVELRDQEPVAPGADCSDDAWPLVDVEVAIESLSTTLVGRGTLPPVWPGQPAFSKPEARVDVDELGACEILLGDDQTERYPRELACTLAVYGESQCYDRTPLNPLPVDARSGLDVRDFIARGLAAFPLELACEGSARRATLDLEVAFPEEYCSAPGFVPVIVTPQFAALGLSTPMAGYVSDDGDPSCTWIVDERCQGRVGEALLQCIRSLPRDEGERPRAEPCAGYAVTFSDPVNEVRITIEEAADATIAVEVVARGFTRSKDIDEPDVRCRAQRVLGP